MFTNRIIWGVLLLAWMAGSTWWHVCKIKFLCADAPSAAASFPAPLPAAPALVVTDASQFRFAASGNFSFARSGTVADRRGVGALLDSLTAYLTTNPGKTVIISGYYAPEEQNSTTFDNLGLARANNLKQQLLAHGLPDSLIIITGVKAQDLTFSAKGDSLYGGIAINFGAADTITAAPALTPAAPAPASSSSASAAPSANQPLPLLTEPITEADLAKKETFTSVFQPIDLYFLLGEVDHITTEETTKFLREAKTYLTQHKDKKLVLTGHTDSKGPDASNLELSRARANSVKSQLRRSGINTDQIQVNARGETEPKADNSTLSGRKANRRVTVVVQ